MIRYDLQCDNGHGFDGWFRSADGFDGLAAAGHVACTLCGSTTITKRLMAPSLTARRPSPEAVGSAGPAAPVPSTPPVAASPARMARALARLRRHVEATSDYVGPQFAAEARAIHEGRAPERPIHGEARPDEARKLVEDGVPVAPLPFIPRQKTN